MTTGTAPTAGALWPAFLAPADQGRDDLCAVSARGHRVRFADGRELLCGTSGLWNTNLGYGNEAIAQAIAEAAHDASYLHVFRYENTWARRAADALVEAAGPEHYARVLFSTAGGAANDAVMKLVRHYHLLQGGPRRQLVVGLKGSYHGLTYGGFALSGDDLQQQLYGVDQRLVRHVTPNSPAELADLMAREGRRVAAVVVEPVLGAGTLPLTSEYTDALLSLREQYGFLLVADEVATGFGRTGTFLATHRWSAPPDVLLLSKGLTNGTCAASAILTSHAVADAFTRHDSVLVHAETQAGTALTCAAVLATLAETRRLDAVENGRRIAESLTAGLHALAAAHPAATSVTGLGLFQTLHLVQPDGRALTGPEVAALVDAVRREGALVHPAPSGIQLVPALTYTEAELAELLDCLDRGLTSYFGADTGAGTNAGAVHTAPASRIPAGAAAAARRIPPAAAPQDPPVSVPQPQPQPQPQAAAAPAPGAAVEAGWTR
ncbi:daptide-type RiPP biosynthesis aminotransferase [Actinacidiphila sp. ITFR-21]|uniref:daptide-type RiPP biosynthesis aminotransferase n=1 Tax=Actinacidiphila sp. ITFR-21 TaxID=3075199 RepID=UPI00288AC176|nr:daptide-type RiPP biosynthesis aminotransferase [Streptomyces sp. ITFR-21]WNI16180.1 daptide-type RiPP biosynthesis aminotransferase [Streptomyces sp. ITFR-21]